MKCQKYSVIFIPLMMVVGLISIAIIYNERVQLHFQANTYKVEIGSSKRFQLLNVQSFERNKEVENPVSPESSVTSESSSNMTLKGESVFNSRPYNSSHIVYLKVHKAASSTLQNIVMRAGMKRNLTFALPVTDNFNQLGWPAKFNRARNLKKHPGTPDVLCFHTVLSDDLIQTMPQDSFYFTSLRDPFTQLKSLFEYYQMKNCLPSQDSATLLEVIRSGKTSCAVVIKNPQAFDLGLDVNIADSDDVIETLIQNINKQFHFVIIVEYFNECLILLRDMLGWSDIDILYFKSNFKGKKAKPSTDHALLPEDNEENRAAVYKFLKADFALYKHFKNKVEHILALKKDYINAEIVKLKLLQNLWMTDCVNASLPSSKIPDQRFRPYGAGSYGYLLSENGLNNSTCIELALPEIPHVKELNEYQKNLLNVSILY